MRTRSKRDSRSESGVIQGEANVSSTDLSNDVSNRRSGNVGELIRTLDPEYLALIHRFPLRPLRDDAELASASEVVDGLTARDRLSQGESDYLDVLGDLIEKYENEHLELPHVSDGEMLRSLMDEKGVKQADVIRGTGISKTVLSLILNDKRRLTRDQIKVLSGYFGVSPSSFLGGD